MSNSWSPSDNGLNQVMELLQLCQDHTKTAIVAKKLEEFNKYPDFNNYLCFVFKYLDAAQVDLRNMAGIMLKNNIRDYFDKIHPASVEYIRNEAPGLLGDPMLGIRQTCGSILTTILLKIGPQNWPDLLTNLAEAIGSDSAELVDGAFSTLEKICEDHAEELQKDAMGRPLSAIIPKLIATMTSQVEKIRLYSLNCLLYLVPFTPNALLSNIEPFLNNLFNLATNDQSISVRRRVCFMFSSLVEARVNALNSQMGNIVQYMLQMTQHSNPSIAIAACEFWNTIADTEICKTALEGQLHAIVPVLLNSMRYEHDELFVLGADEEENDSHVPDSEQDIVPHASRGRHGVHDDGENAADSDTDWTLRKCAAAGLDGISYSFPEELLRVLIPLVEQKLQSHDWLDREAAILALGAISEGCWQPMKENLHGLVPFLHRLLKDNKFLIRSITCWTISRYAEWIVARASTHLDSIFEPTLYGLLECILDHNKKVQIAACSSFAIFESLAAINIQPYLSLIIETFMKAYSAYQTRALFTLYDAIGHMSKAVGQDLNYPEFVQPLMQPLIQRWNSLSDSDILLLPLLECLTNIAGALAHGFAEFAPPVYDRALKIAQNYLMQYGVWDQNKDRTDEPDERFMVCALDMVSGLCEALGSSVDSLIGNSNYMQILVQACVDPHPEVKQAAFASVGDIAKYCMPHLIPCLDQILPRMVEQLKPRIRYVSVPNNAAWAIGEIALKIGNKIEPFAVNILERLVNLLMDDQLHAHLHENSAITIGRIAQFCTVTVAQHFDHFYLPWVRTLSTMENDDSEKDSAFRGLCMVVSLNPEVCMTDFKLFVDAILSWYAPKEDLARMFASLLASFKSQLGEQRWNEMLGKFPIDTYEQLRRKYNM